MNDQKFKTYILKKLSGFELRLARVESRTLSISPTKKSSACIPQAAKLKRSLPNHIIALRDSGFFKQPRILEEVHRKLGPIYPCDPNRVAVALVRLKKKRQLRITTKLIGKREYIAYVW
jgi:hypothetical protein